MNSEKSCKEWGAPDARWPAAYLTHPPTREILTPEVEQC